MTQNGRADEEDTEREAVAGRMFKRIKKTFLRKKQIPKEKRVQILIKLVHLLNFVSKTWTLWQNKETKWKPQKHVS